MKRPRKSFPALEALRGHHRFRSSEVTRLYQQLIQAVDGTEPLSDRELEILCLIVNGKTSKEIAAHLGIGLKTVETHRTNLLRKCRCKTAAELSAYALRNGLVE